MKDNQLKETYIKTLRENFCGIEYNSSYSQKRMSAKLQERFDKVWCLCRDGDATFSQWENALRKWIDSELING